MLGVEQNNAIFEWIKEEDLAKEVISDFTWALSSIVLFCW